MIIDAFEAAGVPVDEIVACGGLPERNKLLMQIYADVTGREFAVAASGQTPALGSAMFGAVAAGAAAGGYDSIVDAVATRWRISRDETLPADRRRTTPSTTSSTASTSASTTCSDAAATT